MSNKIFQTILNRKIEDFVQSYVFDAKSLFYNGEKLFHPGEYGKFREKTLKELLTFVIPSSYQIGDGFIITSNDKVSTQCDILIYDNEDLPFLSDSVYQFYSIESVLAIGEVKSDLDKTQLSEALKKMAQNKMLQDDRTPSCKIKRSKNKEHDYVFSFLICHKIKSIENIDFNQIYGDIPHKYWHNCILSIEDGLFHYMFPILDLSPELREKYMKILGMNIRLFSDFPIYQEDEMEYPCKQEFMKIDANDKFNHIIIFIKSIVNSLKSITTYETEFLSYSGLDNVVLDK